jgi:hypothetical protein
MFRFGWENIPTPGLILPEEQFFQLIATSYNEGVWRGRVTTPHSGGTLGQPGLVGGTLSELRSEQDEAQTDFDRARLYLPGQLGFPTLEFTQRTESRRSSLGSVRVDRDHSRFTIDTEEFVFSQKEDYTELNCRFESGSIAKNRHRRMQEALGFALCQPVWPSAMIFCSGGKRSEVLKSPDHLAADSLF